MMARGALVTLAVLLAGPAQAQVAAAGAPVSEAPITVTGLRDGITPRQRAVPRQLTDDERALWRQIFADIDAGRTSAAEKSMAAATKAGAIAASEAGQETALLANTAKAQLIVVRGPAGMSRADLAAWLELAKDLPQAAKVAQIAARMPGADESPLPLLPAVRSYARVSAPSLLLAPGPRDAEIGALLKPLLAADLNADAERLWLAQAPFLTPWARAEWAQRIAWSYYGQNDNDAAYRLGLEAASGLGNAGADGAWTAGLAAWRLGNWQDAAAAFDMVGGKFARADIAAAAAYWAGRAWLALGRRDLMMQRFALASGATNSFYGLLAARSLGQTQTLDWAEPDFITADWNYLKTMPGAQRAAALVEIGQLGLADRELRHLAALAPADAYPAILRLAARLDLPATQYSLAVKPPLGLSAPLSARYPAPEWVPARGWRVPRPLVFAHALQESAFITTATSRTGARGLMQLMPGTGREVNDAIKRDTDAAGTDASAWAAVGDMADPAYNIEVGQTYLEKLRDAGSTAGLLPKVIAAYNAGPGSVQRWNASLDDRGDPLLFIESIPFRETRHYVEIVLRNMWMYELRDGAVPASLDAIAAGLWPRFPGLPGTAAIKGVARPVQTLPSVPRPERPPTLFDLPEDERVTVSLRN